MSILVLSNWNHNTNKYPSTGCIKQFVQFNANESFEDVEHGMNLLKLELID